MECVDLLIILKALSNALIEIDVLNWCTRLKLKY